MVQCFESHPRKITKYASIISAMPSCCVTGSAESGHKAKKISWHHKISIRGCCKCRNAFATSPFLFFSLIFSLFLSPICLLFPVGGASAKPTGLSVCSVMGRTGKEGARRSKIVDKPLGFDYDIGRRSCCVLPCTLPNGQTAAADGCRRLPRGRPTLADLPVGCLPGAEQRTPTGARGRYAPACTMQAGRRSMVGGWRLPENKRRKK